MSDVSQIDGSAVRLCREAQGWAINDLAARACLSVKQVRQIEEGGLSSFYSESVKLTAARKVASLLQLSEAQLFGQAPLHTPPAEEEAMLFAAQPTPVGLQDSATLDVATPPKAEPEIAGVHLSRSEPLHFLAQPPEPEATFEPPAAPLDQPVSDLQAEFASTTSSEAPATEPSKPEAAEEASAASGNYFLKILVLFLVAIAVAALLRPKSVETSAPAASEANTGQSMTQTPATTPADTSNASGTPVATGSLPADTNKASDSSEPAAGAAASSATPVPATAPTATPTPTGASGQ